MRYQSIAGQIQYNSDCEGPVSLNDNAFELCATYIQDGAQLFSQLSAYDDYLADIKRQAGYQAGFTLRLLVPFLTAWDVSYDELARFSAESIALVRGANIPFRLMEARECPRFLISTSYEPYATAVADLIGLSGSEVYCTKMSRLMLGEINNDKALIRRAATRIVEATPIILPETAASIDDLPAESRETIAFMDHFVGQVLPRTQYWRLMEDTKPVGDKDKLEAVRAASLRTGISFSRQFYVGDSITDMKVFEFLADAGGCGVSFNGNRYALRHASVAAFGPSAVVIALAAECFRRFGLADVLALAHDWTNHPNRRKELATHVGIAELLSTDELDDLMACHLAPVTASKREKLTRQSEKARKALRGIAVGRLG